MGSKGGEGSSSRYYLTFLKKLIPKRVFFSAERSPFHMMCYLYNPTKGFLIKEQTEALFSLLIERQKPAWTN